MGKKANNLKSSLINSAGAIPMKTKSPDEQFKELFHDAQMSGIFSDGKSFVDLVPKRRTQAVLKEYELAKQDPHFVLEDFIKKHFSGYNPNHLAFQELPKSLSPRQYVSACWPSLTRRNRLDRGSLLTLPYEYIVPGGRFNELFYWDSYFIMLGLATDNKWDEINDMMKNYKFMIRKYGFVPTANRSYFLSRSQPPFFSHMVRLLASHYGNRILLEYLPYLLAEYRFWTFGRKYLLRHIDKVAYHRSVRLPNGGMMTRYYDGCDTPRPESLNEDETTARKSREQDKSKLFLDLRAAAESGWDFSSRWFRSQCDLESIHTTDILPVDLNCLIYDLESLITKIYGLMNQPRLALRFEHLANARADLINELFWDEKEKFYYDYDFKSGNRIKRRHVAGIYALFSGLASETQAKSVKNILKKEFLKEGGLVTTNVPSGEQWDFPNAWAPLQWVAIVGLRKYGYDTLAKQIADNWTNSVEIVYHEKKTMIEKYDAVSESRIGGGGEYPVQNGFGWTNGVYAALKDGYFYQ